MENAKVIHEVDFCAQMAEAINGILDQNPSAYPFRQARIEGLGRGAARRKRKDLCFFDVNHQLVLCGEVKLPGTREGLSPYSQEFCEGAYLKASNEGVQFFFTWNVNEFVLWDVSLCDRPLLERHVWQRTLRRFVASPEDVAREENLAFIKTHFLPDLVSDLADFLSGRRREWLPPADIFIRLLESHLDWPVQLASAYILRSADDLRAQRWMTEQEWTFVRRDQDEWAKAVDNMAKTLAYVWANRLIFYKALRARFPDLPRLELRPSVEKPRDALTAFSRLFRLAVKRSGDYEPLLMPQAEDWDAELVFHPPGALDAWRGFLRGIEWVDFSQVSSDLVGRIFQKLIGPEERHRFGQHYTGDDVVDLINVFCIQSAGATVLDPACGSGSFLVRGYYRKRHLAPARPHVTVLGELFGCDISLYPAHLATLNLAAREINEEANYPRIVRRNFFDVEPGQPFCHIPGPQNEQKPVLLPALDAVVGNPPYVRQEKIEKPEKARFGQLVSAAWPDLRLSGRSDLHCYFWPVATRLLKPDGYFGFLTSSSWLDVEYGFALQGWLLRHFRIVAIMESAAEPWFEDARVKTCVTILQRCDDESARMANRVRFVRFNRKLAEVIGVAPGEEARQAALEALRGRILSAKDDHQDQDLRIIVKTQEELWRDGVRAGAVLRGAKETAAANEPCQTDEDEQGKGKNVGAQTAIVETEPGAYCAGKWGRYVRAPDFYFEIMRRFGERFVPFGEIADIRRGITSGCDAFFMPKDITGEVLRKFQTERDFRRNAGGAPRKDVESGKLRVIQAGDRSVHAIEAKYLAPEVHSLMEVNRLVVRAADLNRVVILVGEPMQTLKNRAPWVWRYLLYGMESTFTKRKSGAVVLPLRSTCAARDTWYDLTALVRPGFALWPKIHKYRHLVPANEEGIICNCNLYDIYLKTNDRLKEKAILGVLNSTLVGFFKAFYGRFAGTETTLKTEIVDLLLMEVPDIRKGKARTLDRLAECYEKMKQREVYHLLEPALLNCHSPERASRLAQAPLVLAPELMQPDRMNLDDAVLQLLGIDETSKRQEISTALRHEVAIYFRQGRVVEIQAMKNRSKAKTQKLQVHDLAADVWDAAGLDDATPLAEWLSHQPESASEADIPEERPAVLANPLFGESAVYFGKAQKTYMDCASRGQAELVARLASLGVSGKVGMPADLAPCFKLLDRLNTRHDRAMARFRELAEKRTGDERLRQQMMDLLERWFVLGHEVAKPARRAEPEA